MTQNGAQESITLPPQIRLNLLIQDGQLQLGTIDLQNVPNGWQTAHMMLLAALNTVLGEIIKEHNNTASRIQVTHHLPKGM